MPEEEARGGGGEGASGGWGRAGGTQHVIV